MGPVRKLQTARSYVCDDTMIHIGEARFRGCHTGWWRNGRGRQLLFCFLGGWNDFRSPVNVIQRPKDPVKDEGLSAVYAFSMSTELPTA